MKSLIRVMLSDDRQQWPKESKVSVIVIITLIEMFKPDNNQGRLVWNPSNDIATKNVENCFPYNF